MPKQTTAELREATAKLLDHDRIYRDESERSFNFMEEMEKQSQEERKQLTSFERINDFDSKFIKKRSSTDMNPPEVELNEQVLEQR